MKIEGNYKSCRRKRNTTLKYFNNSVQSFALQTFASNRFAKAETTADKETRNLQAARYNGSVISRVNPPALGTMFIPIPVQSDA